MHGFLYRRTGWSSDRETSVANDNESPGTRPLFPHSVVRVQPLGGTAGVRVWADAPGRGISDIVARIGSMWVMYHPLMFLRGQLVAHARSEGSLLAWALGWVGVEWGRTGSGWLIDVALFLTRR